VGEKGVGKKGSVPFFSYDANNDRLLIANFLSKKEKRVLTWGVKSGVVFRVFFTLVFLSLDGVCNPVHHV
jgi:hypothetical protein